MCQRTRILSRVTLAVCLAIGLAAPLTAADPVEDLRAALPLRIEDITNPTDAVLKFRQESLQRLVDALVTIPDLRRALALDEWKGDPTRGSEKLLKIDLAMRGQIDARLRAGIREVIKSGDATSRLAIASMFSEMGPTVRAVDPLDTGGFARTMTEEVKALAMDKDLAVRQEGLRALGNINARAKDVVGVFLAILAKDTLGPRRLAADGLGQLVRVATHLKRRSRGVGIEASAEEVLETARLVLENAPAGLGDADPEVRALCWTALKDAGQSLADLIGEAFNRKDYPPKGRPLSDDERKLIEVRQALVRKGLESLKPVFKPLNELAPAFATSLGDPALLVRLSAVETMESVANLRVRMRRRVLSVPSLIEDGKDTGPETARFLTAMDPLAAFLAKDLHLVERTLSDPDARLRRTMLDFLENLEEAAEPVANAIARALADPDRFVRWSAVRTLGYLPKTTASKYTKEIARLLADPDFSVRMQAVKALQDFGAAAREAAPALAAAVREGDAEFRVEVMYALQGLDPIDARIAVPSLIEVLGHPDPRVRRAAAETLGRLGELAREALPALRRALGDEDQEVRIQAHYAILNISLPAKKK